MKLRYSEAIRDRITAEALRVMEENGLQPPSAAQAEIAIAQGQATVEQRILERARLLAPDIGISGSLTNVQRIAKLLAYAGCG